MFKFIKDNFFTFIILIFSLIILIYIFYKSEIYFNGEKKDYYFQYYLISFSIFIFSIISFFFTKKTKEYCSIIIFSTLIGLYIFEFYLTDWKHKYQSYEKLTGKKFDKRSKLEIYNDLKKTENNIFPSVHPIFHMSEQNENLLPLSGISNSTTIVCNENGYYQIYESDRYGFNNPDQEWDQDLIEFFIVGDSYAQGACVNRPNDIASNLRKFSEKSVISVGYGGNGPLLEYASLREYFPADVKINKVLWLYYENDLFNLSEELENNILKKYLIDLNFSQNLKLKQNEIDNLNKKKMNNFLIKFQNTPREEEDNNYKDKLIKFLKLYNTRSKFILRNAYNKLMHIEDFKNILKLSNNFVKKNNSELFFVYIPSYYNYKYNFRENNYKLIKKLIDELGITFIDLHHDLLDKEFNSKKNFPFRLAGHFNVIGYEKVSKYIFNFTNSN
jgi:hypothetical protein